MNGPRLHLRAAAVSHTGRHRTINEDAAFTAPWGAAVADGVGGGPAGELASSALVHRFAANRLSVRQAEQLSDGIRAANWDLRLHAERDPGLRGMATTFTGLFVSTGGELLLAHTGDSRAYLLRDRILDQQSRDDSLVQALVDQGLVAAEDAASHPRRNVITASLSGAERDGVSVTAHRPQHGDRWMLCSDGLSDYVSENDIRAALTASDEAEDAAARCVMLALDAETRDNVTVVVCDVVLSELGPVGAVGAEASFFGAAAERFMEGLEPA